MSKYRYDNATYDDRTAVLAAVIAAGAVTVTADGWTLDGDTYGVDDLDDLLDDAGVQMLVQVTGPVTVTLPAVTRSVWGRASAGRWNPDARLAVAVTALHVDDLKGATWDCGSGAQVQAL